jgi:hypothetical protein
MPTNIQLNAIQRGELAQLRDTAQARGSAIGTWSPFYDYLARATRNTVLDEGLANVTAADMAVLGSLVVS